jgi:hypothetical protein
MMASLHGIKEHGMVQGSMFQLQIQKRSGHLNMEREGPAGSSVARWRL